PQTSTPAQSSAFVPPERETQNEALSGQPSLPTPEVATPTTGGGMQSIQQGDVRYITGGIGDEEREALDAVKKDYNLHVTSTNKDGEFNGDTQIVILGKGGEKLVDVVAGPLFYAQLPAGHYTLQAVNGGVQKQQKVTIGGKDARVYLRW